MTNPEEPFLRGFFSELEAKGICYAVMRNSESLPKSLGGSDLDLLVADEVAGMRVVEVAVEVAARYHGGCTAKYQSDEIVTCWGGCHDDGSCWGLHIDIVTGVKHLGVAYFDAIALLSERVRARDSFYRCGKISNVVSFLKEILCNKKTKKNYYELARAAYRAQPERIKSAIEGCANGKAVWALVEGLLVENRSDEFIAARAELIASTILKGGSFVAHLKYNWSKYRRLFIVPGFTVAFLGTDGSGKSTLIESIKPFFERMLHSEIHYEHLRPNLIPSLARLAGKPKMEGPVTNPHGGKAAGYISSIVRFFYYYIDYTFGYLIKILPILARRPTLVVFDRYYYEYMIDEKRCALRLIPGFARLFSWFIPKPDLILCLGGNPAKIFARKPETSLEEVTRQVQELKEFCAQNKRALWIDTTIGLEESRDAVLTAIMERMSNR